METSSKLTAANKLAINNFQEYLKIPSVHPNIDYNDCIKFLTKQANSLKLPIKVYEPVVNKPIVVISWIGTEKSLPSVLLNSHMDVVPVYEDQWKHPPFSAHIDEKGDIYARGTQDMKCVAIQYLEAVRRLKEAGVTCLRTIHLSFVPDEEIGGRPGMASFVKTDDFKALNVGFALDEGLANPTDEFVLFYGERYIWHALIRCAGTPGHGSLLLPDTAGEKIHRVMDKFMRYRSQEKARLESNPELTIGDVTTINVTQLFGGVQSNVVPPVLSVMFDIRLAVNVDADTFEAEINQWCKEAGDGITIEYEQKDDNIPVTKLDASNPWWVTFKSVADKLKLKLKPQIFPGGTDSRFVRELGVPAIGFSPMNNTPVLLHDHNEFLNTDVFLKGIEIYEKLLPALANLEDRSG